MKKCNKLYAILAGYRSESLPVDFQPAPETFAVESDPAEAAMSYAAAVLQYRRATVVLYEVCFTCPSVSLIHAHNLGAWSAAESIARHGPAGVWGRCAVAAAQKVAPPEWTRAALRRAEAANNA